MTADLVGTEETKLEDIEALDLVTDLASLANLLSPATKIQIASLLHYHRPSLPPISLASSSIGCLRAVMSLKVQRKRTTTSRSFLMGEMCINSQSGVPGKWPMLELHKGIRTTHNLTLFRTHLGENFTQTRHQEVDLELTFDKIFYPSSLILPNSDLV